MTCPWCDAEFRRAIRLMFRVGGRKARCCPTCHGVLP